MNSHRRKADIDPFTEDVTASTLLYPRVARDTDTPDLGYHYDALDYAGGSLTVESGVILTVTNGAAAGIPNGGLTVNGTLRMGQQITNAAVAELPSGPLRVLLGGNASAAYTDADADGLPDWWENYYFGNLNQTAGGDPNADGNTLLYDYLNGLNPNVISFSLTATNDYVNQTNVTVQAVVTTGAP